VVQFHQIPISGAGEVAFTRMSGTDRRKGGMHSKRTNEGTGAFQGEGIEKKCFKNSASAKAQIRLLANTNLRAWCKTIVTFYIKQGGYNSFAPSP